MQYTYEAYLDIETTGLSRRYHHITVIGIYLTRGVEEQLVQLVGDDVTADNVLRALRRVDRVFTYNGSRFDLPFIEHRLGVSFDGLFSHCDLMYDCWRRDLRGGLKAVERRLGITRETEGVDGLEAVRLWRRYAQHGDREALAALLKYNEEDVRNLRTLRERLS